MKNNTKKLLCILLAIAAAVCVIFACFMLTKHKQTDSASSGAASVSQFGSVADFDYEAFDYRMVWTKTAIGAASKRWTM